MTRSIPNAAELPLVSSCDAVEAETRAFYRQVLLKLNEAGVRYMVGGAYALNCYSGVQRPTKDLDLFIRQQDFERIAELMRESGYVAELTYPHWLGKVHAGAVFIDLIFSSGNAVADVDDRWFEHAAQAEVLDVPVLITPVEEMLWSKAFIMERERYDGADVAHLIHARARELDWQRLLDRFGDKWRVLLSHLMLFGFIYPAERDLVPSWVMDRLLARLASEVHAPAPATPVCQGTLLSREQYLPDIEQEGYRDARAHPVGKMSEAELEHWTNSIPDRR